MSRDRFVSRMPNSIDPRWNLRRGGWYDHTSNSPRIILRLTIKNVGHSAAKILAMKFFSFHEHSSSPECEWTDRLAQQWNRDIGPQVPEAYNFRVVVNPRCKDSRYDVVGFWEVKYSDSSGRFNYQQAFDAPFRIDW